MVFPEAVDSQGHEVVHCVVGGCDGGEYGGDAGDFGGGGDRLETEVGGGGILGLGLLWLGGRLGEAEGAGEAAVLLPDWDGKF